jgi:hypothetical protein
MRKVAGSIPVCVHFSGDVAQMGERQLCKLDVVGSIPIISTRTLPVPNPPSGREGMDRFPICAAVPSKGGQQHLWVRIPARDSHGSVAQLVAAVDS